MDDQRQQDDAAGSTPPVTLVKGRHRWTFSCEPGCEALLLRHVNELARREDTPFDYFDAALVSHQLSRRLKPGLFRNDMDEVNTRPAA